MSSLALIIGTGPGLSASIARALAARSYRPILAARDTSDLVDLRDETNGVLVDCDASDPDDVERLFAKIDDLDGTLDVAVYNPSARSRGPIAELTPQDVRKALDVTAFGAFLMAHHAAKRMQATGQGTMLFTGASAGVKGFAESAPFAMGKFALRGLCQALARELHPKNIHIGHIVIDGGIAGTPQRGRSNEMEGDDNMLDPDQVAQTYMNLLDQHRSSWAWEIELRPWIEKF